MVKVISKIKQPYDYVWSQGDPTYFWKRKEQIVKSPWEDLISDYGYDLWKAFGNITFRKAEDNAYVLYIGEIPYFIISKRNRNVPKTFQEPEFCVNNIKILTTNDSKKIGALKEIEEFIFQKTEKIRNEYDSPIILFTRKEVYIDLDFTREDFLYKHIINKFNLSSELIAQQIEQWFSNRSVRMMNKVYIQNDHEKLLSHGFDKRISFRHRNGE